ncbi:MAG: ABC transporter ATP-binding protein [Caldilineales bacterium]|nr:ABC transporter ATP-binding protein [Caldilineales bacterium]
MVLRGADCDFAEGEFTALLGRSGSGKSTLLNLISGIDKPDQGAIFLQDHDLTAMSERERTLFRRQNIGFIFQFFNLLPTLTALENVSLPLELTGISPRQAQQRGEQMLAEVGLADRGRTFPDRLSGGEQQRIAIARALVHNPPIVLADEPTGNLDENTGRDVMALLMRLTQERGHNLVMVTHSHRMAALADRTYRLQEGRLELQTVDSTQSQR